MSNAQNVSADCSPAHGSIINTLAGTRLGQGLCTVHKDRWPWHYDSHEFKFTFCFTSESPGVGQGAMLFQTKPQPETLQCTQKTLVKQYS